ncbi:hypothetical protein ACFQ51_49900 [Streptomyces kaempferi]
MTVQRDVEGTVALRETGGDGLGVRRTQRAAQFQHERSPRRGRTRLVDHGKNGAPRRVPAAHPPSREPGTTPAAHQRTGSPLPLPHRPDHPSPPSTPDTPGRTAWAGWAGWAG